ncbi:BLOC-2 complex member HPS6 [Rhinophrynus dorsalis]
MMKYGPPELVCDLSAFGRQQILRDVLQVPPGESRVFTSPDGRHLFVLLPQKRKVLSFLRLPAEAPLSSTAYLEKSWAPHSPPLAGLLFQECTDRQWVLTLVWESGQAEVWSPPRSSFSKGWDLLQSLELCNSPRARVVSVCSSGANLVWCEERPPSESKQLASSRRSPYRYCICQRLLVWQGQQVTLGSMKIVLHHSPLYRVLASSHHIFMVPDGSMRGSGTQVLLVYCPLEDNLSIATTSRGRIHSKSLSEGESDFKKMVFECVGYMTPPAPDIMSFVITGTGELLLMNTKGEVHLLYPNGIVRHICDFPVTPEAKVKIQIFGGTLVCALDTVLYLVDTKTGKLMEKVILHAEEIFFMKILETDDVQLLTKTGIYKIGYSSGAVEDNSKCEPALLEMVYEEACKYYQRRSLSSTKLTVQALKKEGMFQAPIALSSLLRGYQKDGKLKHPKYADLLDTMSNELRSCLTLEHLKTQIINASEYETKKYCEDLVDQEMDRLLQADMNKENLSYINSLFSIFPMAAWMCLKNKFQFHQNGDGRLVAIATAEVWKKVLGPLPSPSKESPHNGACPLFEVICQSLYTFEPKWLPGFVQLAQECSGLSRSFNNTDNCEGVPLYKRALSVVSKRKNNTTVNQDYTIEIEILLCSRRPQAVIQAIHILISLQQWERVMEVTQKFSQLSPIITKNIFTTLLIEFVRHRHLDSYANQLCDICPEDMTATDILRIVLQNMPEGGQTPFSHNGGMHLTVGLLKPLLNKVLQNQRRQDMKSVDTVFPPSTPQRKNKSDPDFFIKRDGGSTDTSPLNEIYATNGM